MSTDFKIFKGYPVVIFKDVRSSDILLQAYTSSLGVNNTGHRSYLYLIVIPKVETVL